MKQASRQARGEGHLIGLVPTMGALHEGHFSLVRAAKHRCSSVAVSIFVNPKQFAPDEDLDRYPRQWDSDREQLEKLDVQMLFAPAPEEMYPNGFRTYATVEGLSERLEGRARPGHFRGVATVVLKLFEIVQPHFAFLGRKDAQQARIIQQLVTDMNLETEPVIRPIAREPDGLALSSRNAYLKSEERRAATVLYRALDTARRRIENEERDAAQLRVEIRRVLDSEPLAAVDYAEIVDAETFEPVLRLRRSCYVLLAVFIGATRLIDNMLVEEEEDAFRISL